MAYTARRMKGEKREFEDVSSYSSSKEYKKRRKNRRGRTILMSIAAVFCVLLILFGSGLIYVSTEILGELTTDTITKDPEALGIDSSNIVMDDSVKNIALFGLDTRDGTFTGRSDVIMVLTVDNKHKTLKMTSILRDTRVPIEGNMLSGEYMNWDTKINAAYYYGGPELAIRTLNKNFGLNIEDYVAINFANMAAIVDAFGGVELEITAEELEELDKNLWNLNAEVEQQIELDKQNGTYEENSYPEIKTEDYFFQYADGTYKLNGNQAVAYGRIRYVGGDDERAVRQQKVLKALLSNLQNISYSDYPNIIKELMPLCKTSLDLGDILALTPILTSDFQVKSINVPSYEYENPWGGTAEDGVWYYIYDVTEAAKRISSFIYEENSPYWEEYGDTSEAVTTKSTVSDSSSESSSES